MYIDTHTHLYLPQFDEDRPQMMNRAQAAGVDRMFLPNIDIATTAGMLQMVKDYPGICYPMIGLHPCSVNHDFQQELDQLFLHIRNSEIIAIGEVGLDFYWDKTFVDQQEQALLIQADWAQEYSLPLVLHTRDAIDRTIELLIPRAQQGLTGVFHCFTGTLEQANRIIDLGFYLGIGGVITYKNTDLREVILSIGLDHLVLETDSPYLAPAPKRGKRNESSYLAYISGVISEVLALNVQDVGRITSSNAEKLFNIKKK